MGSELSQAKDSRVNVFEGVTPGTRQMMLNGQLRAARRWCEMFGHALDDADVCTICGGVRASAERGANA